MKRPIKDESMIEKASTIHEQMLLDYIENQEKYIDELEEENKQLQSRLDIAIKSCWKEEN